MVVNHPVVAIIQARMSSTRLPCKVMLDLCGKLLLERVIKCTLSARALDGVWLATSQTRADDIIEYFAMKRGIKVYRGSLEDVLDRYCGAAKESKAQIIVRVTADNPFTEPRLIDLGVEKLVSDRLDYVTFTNIPLGSGVEVFTRDAIFRAADMTNDPYDREHVCPYFSKNIGEFKVLCYDNPIATTRRPDVSVTIDTFDDYINLCKIYQNFSGHDNVPLEEIIRYLDESVHTDSQYP